MEKFIYIYNNITQLFSYIETYDNNQKCRIMNYEIKNQNNIVNLIEKNKIELLNDNDKINIRNIIKLPESNILCFNFSVNTKYYSPFVLTDLNTSIIFFKSNNIKYIKSIFLKTYIIFQCDNCINIIYDYQNKKELLTVEGVVRNKNDMYNDRGYHNNTIFSDESIIVVYTKNKQEVYKFKDIDELHEDKKCVICFSLTERNHALFPCGHTQFCEQCITQFSNCPICRKDVSSVIKIY